MIEAVLAFFAGIMFNWWFLIAVFLVCVYSEYEEKLILSMIFSVFTAVAAWGVFHTIALFHLSWWMFLGIYTAIGFGYVFWRWYRYCDHKTENVNKEIASIHEKYTNLNDIDADIRNLVNRYDRAINFRHNLDRMFHWFIFWPTSAFAHFIGDIIATFKKLLVTWFSDIFDWISNYVRRGLVTTPVDIENKYIHID